MELWKHKCMEPSQYYDPSIHIATPSLYFLLAELTCKPRPLLVFFSLSLSISHFLSLSLSLFLVLSMTIPLKTLSFSMKREIRFTPDPLILSS